MESSILRNKFLIVGCGRFGASIANKYYGQGKNVMIIDKSNQEFDALRDDFAGYKFIGDATDLSFLKKAYIETAKEIVIATGDDNVNILVAYIARKIFDVPEIYIRLDDPSSEVLLKGLKVKAIFPFELSSDEFERIKGGNK